jgi:NAD(P)-dependent dehydrogenase (short-subunit alcohol dehydrogenase family)
MGGHCHQWKRAAAVGIGAACATTLAREGAKVVLTHLDDAGAPDQ